MNSDWGARGSRPHIVFLLVDDWGWDLMPRQPDFRDAVHDRDLERLLPTVSHCRRRRRFLGLREEVAAAAAELSTATSSTQADAGVASDSQSVSQSVSQSDEAIID
jgi:hypothetical protein